LRDLRPGREDGDTIELEVEKSGILKNRIERQ
jgi:hypothetical protein